MSANSKNVNRSVLDTTLFNSSRSLFFPRAWGTVANYSFEDAVYPANPAGDFGSVTTFKLPHTVCTYMGKMLLQFDISRPSVWNAWLAADKAAFDDFLTHAAVEKIELKYGSNTLDSLPGEYIHFRFYNEKEDEYSRTAKTPWLFGPISPVDRAALADSADVTIQPDSYLRCLMEVPFFCGRSIKSKIPQILGSELYVEVTWRPVNALSGITAASIETPVAADSSISNQKLIVEQVYGGPNEQAKLHNRAEMGIAHLFERVLTQTYTDTSALAAGFGSRVLEIPLQQINTSTTYMLLAIRDAEQLNTPLQIDRWTLRGQKKSGYNGGGAADGRDEKYILDKVAIVSNNGTVKVEVPVEYHKPFGWGRRRSGPGHTDGLVAIDFSHVPGLYDDATGSINIGYVTNATLKLTFIEGPNYAGSGTTEWGRLNGRVENPTIRVDAYAIVRNIINYKGGQVYVQYQ